MKNNSLTIALPKGKLASDLAVIFKKTGYPYETLENDTRKLLISYPDRDLTYIICRPTDIPTYVEYGAADIGIVGKDTIAEQKRNIFELVDLGFSRCKFVVAVPSSSLVDNTGELNPQAFFSRFSHLRVATKFPNVALEYFEKIGLRPEIIPLHGNIELAPQVGLAEAIVDIVSTGRTLKENNMEAVDEIFEATARLVANRVSFRLKYDRIKEFAETIKSAAWED